MMEFYTDSIHKARKEHKCMLCQQPILKGEKYHRQSGKYCGDFFDRCLHMHCNTMITEYVDAKDEYEFDADWVTEWLRDLYCYDCKDEEECTVETLTCEKIIKDFSREGS